MRPAPSFMFACAVAAISGAVGGAAIDTRPIQRAGVGTPGYMPEPTLFAAADDGLAPQPVLPDHYAMDTPTGRIEVAELAANGLYSQRRFGWRDTIALPPPVPVVAEPLSGDEPPRDEVPSDEGAADTPAPGDMSTQSGGARVIQVAAPSATG